MLDYFVGGGVVVKWKPKNMGFKYILGNTFL